MQIETAPLPTRTASCAHVSITRTASIGIYQCERKEGRTKESISLETHTLCRSASEAKVRLYSNGTEEGGSFRNLHTSIVDTGFHFFKGFCVCVWAYNILVVATCSCHPGETSGSSERCTSPFMTKERSAFREPKLFCRGKKTQRTTMCRSGTSVSNLNRTTRKSKWASQK